MLTIFRILTLSEGKLFGLIKPELCYTQDTLATCNCQLGDGDDDTDDDDDIYLDDDDDNDDEDDDDDEEDEEKDVSLPASPPILLLPLSSSGRGGLP